MSAYNTRIYASLAEVLPMSI